MKDRTSKLWFGFASILIFLSALFGISQFTNHGTSEAATVVTPQSIPREVLLAKMTRLDPTTTTTTAAPTTTTTARRVIPRANRSTRTTTAPTTTASQVTSGPGWNLPENCPGGYRKTLQDAHRCWDGLIAQWGDWPQSRMFSIMFCESTGDQNSINASNHVGLFQIDGGVTDPYANANQAHEMWKSRKLQPWTQCL